MMASTLVSFDPVCSHPLTALSAMSAAAALSYPNAPVLMQGEATERHPCRIAKLSAFV